MNMAIAFDQLGNASINGNIDNTVSGRLGAKIKAKKANRLEKKFDHLLSVFDPSKGSHSINSIEECEKSII